MPGQKLRRRKGAVKASSLRPSTSATNLRSLKLITSTLSTPSTVSTLSTLSTIRDVLTVAQLEISLSAVCCFADAVESF